MSSFRIKKDERFDTLILNGGRLDFYATQILPTNVLIPTAGTFTPTGFGTTLNVTFTRIGNMVTMTWGRASGNLNIQALLEFSSSIPEIFLPDYVTLRAAASPCSVSSPIYTFANGVYEFNKISIYEDTVLIKNVDTTGFAAGNVIIFPGSVSWTVKNV